MIMGNTINDNFTIFYVLRDEFTLWGRTVSSDGNTIGPAYFIANTNDFRMQSVVWHPYAKRFMIVGNLNNTLYALAANVNGQPLTPARVIATGIANYPRVTWTLKKKFIVFYRKNDQIYARRIKKNAKGNKPEKQITSFSQGLAVPRDASTEEDGVAACYYAYYSSSSSTQLIPRMVRVNRKLKLQVDCQVAPVQYDQYQWGYMSGAYDPDTGTHAISFANRFALFDKNGNAATPSPALAPFITIPNGGWTISGITYDSTFQRFAAYYIRAWADESTWTEYTYIHFAYFDSNGNVIDADVELGGFEDEADGRAGGINRRGERLGILSEEGYGFGGGPVRAWLHYY